MDTEKRKGSSNYPELDAASVMIANQVGILINSEAAKVESSMPYKSQYMLERVIYLLDRAV